MKNKRTAQELGHALGLARERYRARQPQEPNEPDYSNWKNLIKEKLKEANELGLLEDMKIGLKPNLAIIN